MSWELPANSVCAAIRVQLRGIHTLGIDGFRAFMGDNFVSVSKAEQVATENSFASVAPITMREGMYAMLSPIKKRQLIKPREGRQVKRDPTEKFDVGVVTVLSKRIDDRYQQVVVWKQKVMEHCTVFSQEEMQFLYSAVFIPSVEEPRHGLN